MLLPRALSCAALAALAVAFAPPADALRRSHDGTGQALLAPYYTVRDGRATLFTLDNHADTPKAMRVVLAEGRNGRPVLVFNVYLAARDTWTAALTADPSGARLSTSDASCTVPQFPGNGTTLRPFAFGFENNDGLGTDVERLTEGQFEAIEMGELGGQAAELTNTFGCTTLVTRHADGGIWAQSPNADIAPPSGQLSLETQIVDVAAGAIFPVPVIALDEFSAGARHESLMASNALRFIRPTLPVGATRFTVEGNAFVPADRPADAVSLLLMAASMEAPFLLDPGLAASTEWVVALPTRQAYLDDRRGGELAPGSAPRGPFAASGAGPGTSTCNAVRWQPISRAGQQVGMDDHFLPTPVNSALCAQITRVPFVRNLPSNPNQATPLTTHGLSEGRMRLDLRPDRHALSYTTGPAGTHAATLEGLPVLVLPLIEARNAQAAPGRLGTYGYVGHVTRRQTGQVDF